MTKTLRILAIAAAGVAGFVLAANALLSLLPEPLCYLPSHWRRVELTYIVEVYFLEGSRPESFVILVPAPLLDGKPVRKFTTTLQRMPKPFSFVTTERGTFMKMTEANVDEFGGLAFITKVLLTERPTRWLVLDNPLRERFSLSSAPGPSGQSGYWIYVEAEKPVLGVTVYSDITPFGGYWIKQVVIDLSRPKPGWNWVEGETYP